MEHSVEWKDSEELAMLRIVQLQGRNQPDDYKSYICKVDPKYKKTIWDSQLKKYWEEHSQGRLNLETV